MEAFQSITANPLKKCPECGKLKLQRLLGTGAGLIFKGSGFYETDYRSESYKKGAESEKPKSDSKTDSKKETKTETKKADKKPTAKKETSS
jgi:putative FmdB family regulatory protein